MLQAMLASRGSAGRGQPAKRQKRADVLESLGLGGEVSVPAGRGGCGQLGSRSPMGFAAGQLQEPITGRPSRDAAAAQAQTGPLCGAVAACVLSGTAAAALSGSPPLAGQLVAEPSGIPGTPLLETAGGPAAGPAELPSDGDRAAAEPGAPQEEACRPLQRADGNLWKAAFSNARDRWDIDEQTLRGRYYDSTKRLYFEWDQHSGLLFQYFYEERDGAGDTAEAAELHPVWSSVCPETHAEVWELLPLPPSDPAAQGQAGADVDADAAAVESQGEQAGTPGAAQGLMLPPSLQSTRKKRPAASAGDVAEEELEQASGDGAAAPLSSDTASEPSSRVGSSAGHRCGRSSGSGSSVSSASGATGGLDVGAAPQEAEEDATVGRADGAEGPDDDSYCKGSSTLAMLDSDDEEVLPLASEDCALPPAPAERPEPRATDLDLDMFAE